MTFPIFKRGDLHFWGHSCWSFVMNNMKEFQNTAATRTATSFPGSLILRPPWGGKMTDLGNEVARTAQFRVQ